MRPVAGNYSNVEASIGSIARWTSRAVSEVSKVVIVVAEMSRGCITRWTSSNISGIKGSSRSGRVYGERLAKKKIETQGQSSPTFLCALL